MSEPRCFFFCLLFAVLFIPTARAQTQSADAQTKTFNVRNFGATGDGQTDDQVAIAKAVATARAWTQSVVPHRGIVYFPAGTYNVSHVMGLYAINVIDARNLTLQGQDCVSGLGKYCVKLIGAAVTLNVQRKLPEYNSFFNIEHSDHITIDGFYLDKRQPYFSQGKVVDVMPTERALEIKVDEGYEDFSDPWIDQLLNTIVVFTDPTGRNWDHSDAACANGLPPTPADHDCHNFHILSKIHLAPRTWKLLLDQTPPQEFRGRPYLMWRNLGWQPGFMIDHSKDITVKNIFYTGGGGPGLHIQASDGDILVRDFTIDVPPGSGRLFAATSGFNGARNRSDIVLDHVRVAHTDDDAVHFADGFYYPALEQSTDGRKVRIALCYDGDFQPGDHLEAWNWASKSRVGDATVVSSQVVTDSEPLRFPRTCDVTLDRPLPKLTHLRSYDSKMLGREADDDDRILNLSFNTHLTVENSYLSTMRARCAIIQVSADIANNVCANVVLAGFIVGPEFSWGEGYAVQNVTIIGNHFENVSGTSIYVADILNSNRSPDFKTLTSSVPPPRNIQRDNSNIVIENNSFHDLGTYARGIMGIRGVAVTIENARNVIILGNHVEDANPLHRDAPVNVVVSPTTTQDVTTR
jgi:hypothetical protein